MNRDRFLARVREAAQLGRQYRPHLRDDLPPRVGYVGGGDDLVARMAMEVAEVGGEAHVVQDFAEARRKLGELIAASGARSALCWQHPVLERLDLCGLCNSHSVAWVDYDVLASLPPDQRQSRMLQADVGISSVWRAVAETGTLAMASGPGTERLASLLPPVHIAVVEADQLLPDLFDLFDLLQVQGVAQLPSNLTLITGPSKTGDIELKLTTGVHGPGKWQVILIRSTE